MSANHKNPIPFAKNTRQKSLFRGIWIPWQTKIVFSSAFGFPGRPKKPFPGHLDSLAGQKSLFQGIWIPRRTKKAFSGAFGFPDGPKKAFPMHLDSPAGQKSLFQGSGESGRGEKGFFRAASGLGEEKTPVSS